MTIQIDWVKDKHYKTLNAAIEVVKNMLERDPIDMEFYKTENGIDWLDKLQDDLKQLKVYIREANKHEV